MKLKNLKKVPFEIVEKLIITPYASKYAARDTILQLLFDDSASVNTEVSNETIDYLIAKNYIGFYPATESGIKDNDRNTFLIINLEDFSLQNADNNVSASGAIYITTDKSHALLENKKLRLLELADAIDTMLDGEKLSSAGQIRIISINYVVFSDFRCGYRINFRINDQQQRKAEL